MSFWFHSASQCTTINKIKINWYNLYWIVIIVDISAKKAFSSKSMSIIRLIDRDCEGSHRIRHTKIHEHSSTMYSWRVCLEIQPIAHHVAWDSGSGHRRLGPTTQRRSAQADIGEGIQGISQHIFILGLSIAIKSTPTLHLRVNSTHIRLLMKKRTW